MTERKHTREWRRVKTSFFINIHSCTGPRSVCVVRGNVVCGAHSAHVTGVAEEMRVQREALRARLIGELLTTLLRGGKETQIRTGMHTQEVRSAVEVLHNLRVRSVQIRGSDSLHSV